MTDEPSTDETVRIDQLARDVVADLKLNINAELQAHIHSELRQIYHASLLYRTKDAAGAPSDRIYELGRIESSSRKLREALSCNDPTIDGRELVALVNAHPSIGILAYHLSRHLNPNDERHLSTADDVNVQEWWSDIFDKLEILKDLIATASSQLEAGKQPGRGGARHKSDWARRETAWLLLRLYAENTGKNPGVSNPKTGGEATGPAVRFLTRCLVAFGWDTSPDAAAMLIRDINKNDDPLWT